MSEIIVAGAGLAGLTTALLLAADGHRITVLERDAASPDGSAGPCWESRDRPGVNRFRQPHILLPRWRQDVQRELPEVIAELEARGGLRMNTTARLPDAVTGGARPGDERFDVVTARRPIVEAALAAVADRTESIDICRGSAVTGLLTADTGDGVPQVQGVVTGDGRTRRADLLVDCTGRRSTIAALLERAGATAPFEARESSGFVYYMRYFSSATGDLPPVVGPLLQHFDSVSILTLPSDAGTWSVGFVTSSGDHDLRVLRQDHIWETALALFPDVAHWADGEPLTAVAVIAGPKDRRRPFVHDGAPVATGVVAVGDSSPCTNPSLGRGESMGVLQACVLRDALRECGADDARRLVLAFEERNAQQITPLYLATRNLDRHRLAEIDADIAGREYRTADPAFALSSAIYAAARTDPDVLRAHQDLDGFLATGSEALAGPRMLEKAIAGGTDVRRYPPDAPTRAELLAALDLPHPPHPPHPSRATADHRPVRLHVEDLGHGEPVLLLHGWPDDHHVWRHQIPALADAGYRAIAPDLRGAGASDKPTGIQSYGMLEILGDLLRLLDRLGLARVHVVGHDWGGAIAAMLATMAPARVASLSCLSVGHPGAFGAGGWRQREKSWYMLLFQFEGIAERWLSQDDFANLRRWAGHPDIGEVVARLRDPAALTAGLGLYRAMLPPESLLARPAPLPPIQAPTMGIWSSGDLAVTEPAMTGTERFVVGGWRYERLENTGHWMQLEEPDRISALLLDFLGGHPLPAESDIPAQVAGTGRTDQDHRRRVRRLGATGLG